MAQAPTAARRALRKLPKYLVMSSPLLRAKREPRRLTVRATPKDSASSLFLNQRASMALWATTRGSAPAPKMNRPTNIKGMLLACQTIAAPTKTRAEKMMLALRVPSRSISTPAKRRTKIAATLYIVLNAPTVARLALSPSMSEGAMAAMMS